MFYALNDNKKIEPSRNQRATCPHCGAEVVSKCGEINAWHWAHIKDDNCDNWYEPETQWHINWKRHFGKNNSEVRINKGDKFHIADVYTEENIVIELQNSPISTETIKARENFYGERMIWVINADPFLLNFNVWEGDPDWADTLPDNFFYDDSILSRPGWFIDFQDVVPDEPMDDLLHLLAFNYINDINLYFRASDNPNGKWNRIIISKIKEFNEENLLTTSDPKIKYFTWKWPKKSWGAAKRPVFIDFEYDKLLFVKEGLGTNKGKGMIVSKKAFINKYSTDN